MPVEGHCSYNVCTYAVHVWHTESDRKNASYGYIKASASLRSPRLIYSQLVAYDNGDDGKYMFRSIRVLGFHIWSKHHFFMVSRQVHTNNNHDIEITTTEARISWIMNDASSHCHANHIKTSRCDEWLHQLTDITFSVYIYICIQRSW